MSAEKRKLKKNGNSRNKNTISKIKQKKSPDEGDI